MLQIAIIFLSLFILEVLYFKVADYFNIIDKPSERGSSKFITLRGGGIIFYLGALIWFIFYGREYWLFFTGLSLVTILSFVDDIHSLSARLRLLNYSDKQVMIFVTFYLFSGYFLHNSYYRAAVGETLAMIFLPLKCETIFTWYE